MEHFESYQPCVQITIIICIAIVAAVGIYSLFSFLKSMGS